MNYIYIPQIVLQAELVHTPAQDNAFITWVQKAAFACGLGVVQPVCPVQTTQYTATLIGSNRLPIARGVGKHPIAAITSLASNYRKVRK
jgi:hypothetical protein